MKIVIEIDETKLADAINAKLDVPYVAETTEGKLLREAVSAASKAAVELIGSHSSELVKVAVVE